MLKNFTIYDCYESIWKKKKIWDSSFERLNGHLYEAQVVCKRTFSMKES